MSIITLLLNLYCILVFMGDKNTHKLDYLLIFFQTVMDFVCSGLLGSIYYIYKLRNNASRACGGDVLQYLDIYKARVKEDQPEQVYIYTIDVRLNNKKFGSCVIAAEQ